MTPADEMPTINKRGIDTIMSLKKKIAAAFIACAMTLAVVPSAFACTALYVGSDLTEDGTTILPVSKVSFGFASGGTDFDGKNAANKDLFGGGSGAGVNIQPVAFLVVKDGCVRTIQLSDGNNTVDRALTMIPELVEKVSALIKKDEPAAPKSEQ